MTEDVLHQAHYTRLPLQPIMVMMRTVPPEQFLGHLRCCAIKYLMRVDGKPLEEQQRDYAKGAQYAAWAEEFHRTGTITVTEFVPECHHELYCPIPDSDACRVCRHRCGESTGANDRTDQARELHHYYSDSGSNSMVDAGSIVRLLEDLFPELAPKGADR